MQDEKYPLGAATEPTAHSPTLDAGILLDTSSVK